MAPGVNEVLSHANLRTSLMRAPLARLIPPAALGILLAVALVSSQVVGRRPVARLLARTRGYAEALRAGDAEQVLALRAPSARDLSDPAQRQELERRLATLHGRNYRLDALTRQPDGSYQALIVWLPRDGRGRDTWRLELHWVRDAAGTWWVAP